MRPRLIAEAVVPNGRKVSRVACGGWLVVQPGESAVTVLDEQLHLTAQIRVPTGDAWFAANADTRHIAVVTFNDLTVLDRDGRVLWQGDHHVVRRGMPCEPHCFLDPSGLLWVYLPYADGDELIAVEADTGREIDRTVLESEIGAAQFWPHPDGIRIGLNVVMGQDGSLSWLARIHDGRIVLQDCAGGGLAGFTSDGKRYLGLHGESGEISISDVATNALLAECDCTAIPGYPTDEYSFNYTAELVSDDLVIVGVIHHDEITTGTEHHLLLSTRTLRYQETVEYDRTMTSTQIAAACDRGRWLTAGKAGTLRLWQLGPSHTVGG